jgi:hypothetical protein
MRNIGNHLTELSTFFYQILGILSLSKKSFKIISIQINLRWVKKELKRKIFNDWNITLRKNISNLLKKYTPIKNWKKKNPIQ